jgi:hypothetical protein
MTSGNITEELILKQLRYDNLKYRNNQYIYLMGMWCLCDVGNEP